MLYSPDEPQVPPEPMHGACRVGTLCAARIKDACGTTGADAQRVVDFFAVELSFDAVDDDALRAEVCAPSASS